MSKPSSRYIVANPVTAKIIDRLPELCSSDLRIIATEALSHLGADRTLAKLEEFDESVDIRKVIKAACGKELVEIKETYPLG
jgi:hypothetical protein